MKQRKQRIIWSLILVTATALLMQGCSRSEKTPIVTINDKELYMTDFLYDIFVIEKEGNNLEKNYQANLGYSYWDYEYEGTTMREAAKSSVLTRVIMNELLSDQALQHGFTLSERELMKNKKSINALVDDYSEETLNDMGLTRDVLNTAYNKNALCEKYYNDLSKDFKINEKSIRDHINKADYREYKTECIYIPTVKTEEQVITSLSEEDIKAAYRIISAALEELEAGAEFDTLLNENDNLNYYSRDFIYGNSSYEKGYQDAAVILKNKSYSDIVATNYGYYIIHMLDNNSMDRYEQAVEDAISNEEAAQFATVYNKIKDQYDITINFKYWDTVTIGSITNSNND